MHKENFISWKRDVYLPNFSNISALVYLRDYLFFFFFSALVEHLVIFPRFNIQFVGRYTDTSRTCRVSEWKFHELAHAVVCFRIRLVPQLSLFLRVGDFFAKKSGLRSNAQVRARRKRDSCHSADIHHPRGWHIIPTNGIHFARSIILRTRVCISTYRSARLDTARYINHSTSSNQIELMHFLRFALPALNNQTFDGIPRICGSTRNFGHANHWPSFTINY